MNRTVVRLTREQLEILSKLDQNLSMGIQRAVMAMPDQIEKGVEESYERKPKSVYFDNVTRNRLAKLGRGCVNEGLARFADELIKRYRST